MQRSAECLSSPTTSPLVIRGLKMLMLLTKSLLIRIKLEETTVHTHTHTHTLTHSHTHTLTDMQRYSQKHRNWHIHDNIWARHDPKAASFIWPLMFFFLWFNGLHCVYVNGFSAIFVQYVSTVVVFKMFSRQFAKSFFQKSTERYRISTLNMF